MHTQSEYKIYIYIFIRRPVYIDKDRIKKKKRVVLLKLVHHWFTFVFFFFCFQLHRFHNAEVSTRSNRTTFSISVLFRLNWADQLHARHLCERTGKHEEETSLSFLFASIRIFPLFSPAPPPPPCFSRQQSGVVSFERVLKSYGNVNGCSTRKRINLEHRPIRKSSPPSPLFLHTASLFSSVN